jgi:hypothetical protein
MDPGVKITISIFLMVAPFVGRIFLIERVLPDVSSFYPILPAAEIESVYFSHKYSNNWP